MRRWLLLFVICSAPMLRAQEFHREDVDLFWNAYDKIVSENDTVKQLAILNADYIAKAGPGFKGLVQARNYSDRELLRAISTYPNYWKSIRSDSRSSKDFEIQITADFKKLRKLYPSLSSVPVYFTIGAFRCNGTGIDNKILIGAEMALTGPNANLSEIPEWLHPYFLEMKPRENLALLCTHEYIHTQQKPLVENLLCASLYEGIAEFMACEATGKPSNIPAFAIWENNAADIKNQFLVDFFQPDKLYHWLWGQNPNKFKLRDLGYVMGYKIAEAYYRKASDKILAANQLIELDYTNDAAVEKIVDASGVFDKSIAELNAAYESKRPTIVNVTPFGTNKTTKPGLVTVTLHFSEPLDGYFTGLDYGPLGEAALLKVKNVIGWSTDKKSWSFETELNPKTHYQVLITNNFRLTDGTRLKPNLIDLTTD